MGSKESSDSPRTAAVPFESFAEAVRDRSMSVGVIGLGYVGLPIAISYASAGFRTVGFDIDTSRIQQLLEGSSYVEDVDSELVANLVTSESLIPVSTPSSISECDAVFICVPTPYTPAKDPDLGYVIAATETVAKNMKPGVLVILQSTTYPGTTNEIVRPILERGGRKLGIDFNLAFSPERVDPGNKVWTVENTPKVVGGVTPECSERAALLLAAPMSDNVSLRTRIVSTPEAAEMTKLLENTFRAVNIALVNELALLCERMGVDIWEVIEAAETKPFGFMPFRPGPGVGGHCIAVDPYYLAWRARTVDFHARFIELAAEANSRMPEYTAQRASRMLNSVGKPLNGSKVLALGAAFKAGVSDTRNSPALRVMEILAEQGAVVSYHDPYVDRITLSGESLESVPLSREVVDSADLVIGLVAHDEIDADLVLSSAKLIFDAANIFGGRPAKGRLERL
jgi:UDP-N-acetyl-D-glucosamine dehydrogenase